MRLFGHYRHHHDDPLAEAPAWAVELYCLGLTIHDNQEKTMSDLSRLNTALADLQTEVGDIGTQMDALLAALNGAHTGGDQAAIDQATAAVQAQVDALKAIGARDTPPAPATA